MEIIVQGHKIDTKDIWDIVDIEAHKTMFLNREAGFIIKLVGDKQIKIGENIPYDSYPSEISDTKRKWRKLEKEVREKWEEDKSDIPTFTI